METQTVNVTNVINTFLKQKCALWVLLPNLVLP